MSQATNLEKDRDVIEWIRNIYGAAGRGEIGWTRGWSSIHLWLNLFSFCCYLVPHADCCFDSIKSTIPMPSILSIIQPYQPNGQSHQQDFKTDTNRIFNQWDFRRVTWFFCFDAIWWYLGFILANMFVFDFGSRYAKLWRSKWIGNNLLQIPGCCMRKNRSRVEFKRGSGSQTALARWKLANVH